MSRAPTHPLRSRALAITVHLGLWVLLYLALSKSGGRGPEYQERTAFTVTPRSSVPVAGLDGLFAAERWPQGLVFSNLNNPFYTTQFVPPPSPAPPPPPTTKKVSVGYQGYYQTGDGPKQAIVKLAESYVLGNVGLPIASNVFVASLSSQLMTLTNAAGITNLVPLNVTKEVEVPIP